MKIIKEELLYAGQGIQQLGNQKLPLNYSLPIARLTKKLTHAVKPIDKERKAIISKYNHQADKDEKNQPKPLTMEQREAMEVEINSLMEQEIEFDFNPEDKIKLPSRVASTVGAKSGETKEFEIEANVLALLMPFIES